jgi:adenylate kinase family enzyme
MLGIVQRVLILGRGGAGKSTFARRLAEITGLPSIELDTHFWQPDLTPLSAQAWSQRQERLIASTSWIMDGDLGPHDVLAPRLRAADTVFLLDLPLWLCAWRSLRRGRERYDYWVWVVAYRIRDRRRIRRLIESEAPGVDVRVARRPADVEAFLAAVLRRDGSLPPSVSRSAPAPLGPVPRLRP